MAEAWFVLVSALKSVLRFTVLQPTLCFSNVKGITVPTTSLCFILTQVEMAEE